MLRLLALTVVLSPLACPQELDTVRRIKLEAFQNSQVMEQLFYLTDLYGPRLTGSPEFAQAADWPVTRLKEYGLATCTPKNGDRSGASGH